MSIHERHSGRNEKPINRRPDFGTKIVSERIIRIKKRYGAALVGEIIGTKSGTHYVIREVTEKGLVTTQLGDHTKSRPNPVLMPNDARGILTNPIRDIVLAIHGDEYRNILLEIKEKGGNVEIPPEKTEGFDIF